MRKSTMYRGQGLFGSIGMTQDIEILQLRRMRYLLLASVLAIGSIGYAVTLVESEHFDETHHRIQIEKFMAGEWELSAKLAMFPTFHVLMAGICKVVGIQTVAGFQLISLLLGLPAVFIFFELVRHLPPKMRLIRSIQFMTIPVMFPFIFHVYTDWLSMAVVLGCLLFADRRCYQWAGLFAIAAIALRQNNILWAAMIAAMIYVREFGWRFNVASLRWVAVNLWLFALGALLLGVFIVLNGGVALAEKEFNPPFQLHTANILGCLFAIGLLLLPLHVANLPAMIRAASRHPLPILAILSAGFAILFFTFADDYPLNWMFPDKVVNRVIISAGRSSIWATFFVLAGLLVLASLSVTALRERSDYLIYPFMLLTVGMSWMVMSRYYMLPVALILALRRQGGWTTEILILLIFFALCAMHLSFDFEM